MDVETDLHAEIEQLEAGANFLKARANATSLFYFNYSGHDFERADGLLRAAEYLAAAEKLQARANVLSNFGREYEPSDFAEVEVA